MPMFKPSANLYAVIAASACILTSAYAYAAEVEVKMLNKGSDGTAMVFEPALVRVAIGDSVHFVATDKSHDVQSIASMIPQDAPAFKGQLNQDLVVKFDKPGVYGYRCEPHYGMGMVGLIVVGKPVNEEAAKAALTSGVPNIAKSKFTKLFAEVDAQKDGGK